MRKPSRRPTDFRARHFALAACSLPATAWAHGSGMALLVPGVPAWLLACLATLYLCRARWRRSVARRGMGATIFAVLAFAVLGLVGWGLLSAWLFDLFRLPLGAQGTYAFCSPWLVPALALLANRQEAVPRPPPPHRG